MSCSVVTVLRFVTIAAPFITALPTLAAGIDELPKAVQEELYNKDTLDPSQPLGQSAYRDWKPKRPPPWTIGYASSYAGNTWRADVMNRLQNVIIPKWKKLGLHHVALLHDSGRLGLICPQRRAPAGILWT